MRAVVLVLSLLGALAACGEVTPGFLDAAPGGDAATACTACAATASCVDEVCTCDDGYAGDGLTCADVDECQTDNGGCDPAAACANTEGARSCTCPAGTVGDGETCRAVWALRHTIAATQLDEGFGSLTVGAGGRIYFARRTGLTGSYFRSIDVTTGVVVDHPLPAGKANDFCACGYQSFLVSAGDALYLFGNYGQVLRNNLWADASYPRANARGEAAGAASADRVYAIGGRDDVTNASTASAQAYSGGAGGTWTAASDYPWPVSFAGAYSPAGSGRLYVFGGTADSDNSSRHAAWLDTAVAGASWTTLPDLPANTTRFPSVGEHDGHLLVQDGQRMHLFDRGADAWAGTLPMPPGGDGWRLVMVGADAYAIGDAGGSVVIYQLLAIQ